MSDLPGVSIWTAFDQAGGEFPFWVAPWREGPTIARVFDFYRGQTAQPRGFAAHVFELETRTFRLNDDGMRAVVHIPGDPTPGWLLVHVDAPDP